jgi:hypothetical protein
MRTTAAALERGAHGQFGEQRRLAHARLAIHQHESRTARAGAQEALEPREFALAPDQRFGEQPFGQRASCRGMNALEFAPHFARVGRAFGLRGRHQSQDELDERAGEPGLFERGRGRGGALLAPKRRHRAGSFARHPARAQRVEHRAQAVEIRGDARGLAAHHFGRGESGRAPMALEIAAQQRCEPEVHEPHTGRQRLPGTRGQEQQVGGLEIVVDHAGRVQRLEALRDVRRRSRAPRCPIRVPRDRRGRRARTPSSVGRAVGRESQFLDTDDGRVAHPRQQLELAPQRIRRHVEHTGVEPLDHALGAVRKVEREPHGAHAALAERSQQLVAPRESFHVSARYAPSPGARRTTRRTQRGTGESTIAVSRERGKSGVWSRRVR